MSEPGRINGWVCPECAEVTYAVHIDGGVTPFYLACRAHGGEPTADTCQGMARSLFYPKAPPPPHVLDAVCWEWYAPDARELRKLRRRKPDVAEHCEKGGLLIRPLTDAGRRALDPTHRLADRRLEP